MTRHSPTRQQSFSHFCFVFLLFALFSLLSTPSTHASLVVGNTQGNSAGLSSLGSGLIGYWTFDNQDINWRTGRIIDMSGKGNDAIMANMATSSSIVPGKLGQALRFNGINQFASFVTSVWDNLSIITACAWVYPDTQNTRQFPVVLSNLSSGPSGWDFYLNQYGAGIGTSFDGSVLDENNDPLVSRDHWNYLCISQNGDLATSMRLYVNGSRVPDTANNTHVRNPVSSNRVYIGTDVQNFHFKGRLDEMRVYNRALSATEVRQLYLQGGGLTMQSSQSPRCSVSSISCGLVGYWTFNNQDMNWQTGKVKDRSGSGNDGVVSAMSTSTSPVAGKMGQAMSFNSNNYVAVNTLNNLHLSDDVSISAWVKLADTSSTYHDIIDKANTGSTDYDMAYENNKILFYSSGLTPSSRYSATSITDNKWHHFAAVHTGGNTIFYLDGVQDGVAQSQTGSIGDAAARVTISADGGFGTNGTIDEARIYNRALSAAEVKKLYLETGGSTIGATQNAGCGLSSINCGLVGYWTFNNQDMDWRTGKVKDKSGQGNDGAMSGMSTTTSPVAGKIGQGLKFDGISNYVKVNYNSSFAPSSFTISAWIKPTTVQSSFQFIFDRYVTDYEFGLNGNLLYLEGQIGGNRVRVNSGTLTVQPNVWQHAVLKWDSATTTFYLNGVEAVGTCITACNLTGAFDNTGKEVNIGQRFGNSLFFGGSMDDVRIYNRALSTSEVKQLYNMGR